MWNARDCSTEPGNQGTCLRPEKPQCGSLQKTYAALSGEYENFANKLNGESCREAKTDGSRGTTESFNGACLFLCSTIAAALAEYKTPLSLKCFIFRQSGGKTKPCCTLQATHRENTITTPLPCWHSLRGP